MSNLLATALQALRRGETLALATIVAQKGSTPRTAGTKMLLGRDAWGEEIILSGTVGGGLLEGQAMLAAARVMATGTPETLDFDMTGELAAGADMICGGRLRLFVEPLAGVDLPLFEELAAAVRERRDVRVLTPVQGVRRGRILVERGVPCSSPEIAPAARAALELRAASLLGEDGGEGDAFFVDIWPLPPRIILAGGGHVAQATAEVGALADFEVVVLDDREEFAAPERFPRAALTRVTPEFTDCFEGLNPDGNTFIVIVTRGHVHDASVLEQALATEAGYIGMIGSRRKRDAVYECLRGKGKAGLERVHCPIGLSIGAETPGEIAVSIVGECVAVLRGVIDSSARRG